ncbi:MAG: hypothetical protein M1816_005580 [Peltula sp. TS41687]|nr:MAG: hypothetical protein M1816_005580 [Peltula sp. TS41687]
MAPIAPATLEIDMAIETPFSLNPDWRSNGFSPVVRDMLSHSAICADSTRVYYIDLEPLNKAETEWHCTIRSVDASTAATTEKHAEARIHMCSPSDQAFLQEFGRYERVLGPSDEGVEALQGRNVYRAFEGVVDFGAMYHGVRYVVGRDGESAGVVHKRHSGGTWLDIPKADSFGQVAGMYVNLLTDLPSSDTFVATGLELMDDKAYVTDDFVFDAATGALAEVILGLRYVRIAKATTSKKLARVTTDKFVRSTAASLSSSAPPLATLHESVDAPKPSPLQLRPNAKAKRASSKKPKPSSGRDITEELRNVVASVSGIEASEMKLDSMELAREIETTFKCTLDHAEQMEATSLRQFVACVSNALARAGGGEDVEQDDDDDDDVFSDRSPDEDTVSDISTPDDASDFTGKRLVPNSLPAQASTSNSSAADVSAREAEAERLVAAYTTGWELPALEAAAKRTTSTRTSSGAAVVVTGASGILGSHLVQTLARTQILPISLPGMTVLQYAI